MEAARSVLGIYTSTGTTLRGVTCGSMDMPPSLKMNDNFPIIATHLIHHVKCFHQRHLTKLGDVV